MEPQTADYCAKYKQIQAGQRKSAEIMAVPPQFCGAKKKKRLGLKMREEEAVLVLPDKREDAQSISILVNSA